jgi:hypothetical protein
MRQRDSLSPEEVRELDALDRALAGDRVDADLRELEDLVNDIRATAPPMSPGFAASLEHRVAEGFPATDEHPAPRSPRRWVLFPAAGALCAALVALVVVLGNAGSPPGSDDIASAPRASEQGSAESATSSSSAKALVDSAPPAAAAAPMPQSSGGGQAFDSAARARKSAPAAAPGQGPRKVQRTADVVLSVPADDLQSTSDGVIRTVDRFGGIVSTSSISSDDSTGGEATFALRIPTDKLDDALAALSKLGHVASRSQNLVDITGSFTSVQDRLSDARAERRGLLKALGQATTQAHIDSLRSRLRIVRSQIARLNGDLDALRRRADLSTVNVTVRGDGSKSEGGPGEGGGSWSPGDAARDAIRVLEVIAGVLLIALAILAPLGILALLGVLGVRATRRRRREGALDPA